MAVDLAALRAALVQALSSITEATADADDTFEGVSLRYYFANRKQIEQEKPGFGARLITRDIDAQLGPHPFESSLRGGIMGTSGGSPNPRSWETHGRILDAAERGELQDGVAWTVRGKPFRRWDYLGESTAGKHDVFLEVWNSIKGREWRSHPDNLPVLPKGEPQL